MGVGGERVSLLTCCMTAEMWTLSDSMRSSCSRGREGGREGGGSEG